MKLKASIVVGLLLFSACSLEGVARLEDDERPSTADVTIDTTTAPVPHSDLADMIESVIPSVVNVQVEAVSFDPLGEAQIGEGEGSGVVIEESGYILTNNHVVSGATEVEVVFSDGTKEAGTVVGTAIENDVAVVKVDTDEELTPIAIGDSESLRLGDDVVAIGFPLGLGATASVTRGIVSALNREINIRQSDPTLPDTLQGLLQTDAAINPGNSGGALVDSAGRLVGINTAAAQAGSAENVGFAIPIDVALPVAQEIIEDPAEERSYLGVQIRDLTPALATELGLDSDTVGALVVGLFPDGPAEDAGIEQGDVIVGIDGDGVEDVNDVNRILRDYDPGEIVEVEVLRGSETELIELELGQRPNTFG